jgi:hypothetical protein
MTGITYLYAAKHTDNTNDPHPPHKNIPLCGKAPITQTTLRKKSSTGNTHKSKLNDTFATINL